MALTRPSQRCGEPLPADDRPGGPLRVAVVGIGSAATRAHLPALCAAEAGRAVRVVGVCDPDRARRDAVTAVHPDAAGFAENDEMLEATSPQLLVIATPPSAHLGEMAAALARGVHVLCEKPLGLSDTDVATLRDLARIHPQLALASVHQYRHATPWQWIARAAAGGVREGEPFGMDVRVERPGTDPLSAGGWRADPEHERGILVVHRGEQASHEAGQRREVERSEQPVGVHVEHARLHVVTAGPELCERRRIDAVLVARTPRDGVEPDVGDLEVEEVPHVGAIVLVNHVRGQIAVLRGEVALEVHAPGSGP